MIKIRPEQFEVFERKSQQDFEDELVAHLKNFSPQHAAGAGDEGLRMVIRSGLRNARRYGFQLRGSLRFYVECQVMFGHEFHTEPLMPWAEREFGNRNWANELARADAIHGVAMAYRTAVVGSNGEVEAAAIDRLLARPVSDWLDGDLGDAATTELIAEVYPEKISLAPPTAVLELVDRGKRAAEANDLPAAAGGRVLSALMVAFGHGVLTDPLFPWVSGSLSDTAGRMPQKRAEALAVRAMAYLSDALANMNKR